MFIAKSATVATVFHDAKNTYCRINTRSILSLSGFISAIQTSTVESCLQRTDVSSRKTAATSNMNTGNKTHPTHKQI